ncbi:MAG: hypothetical protein HGA54_00920 [Actinobacteria bacterium]|nr:hypothetical protein [Actinomycetota bacterium]
MNQLEKLAVLTAIERAASRAREEVKKEVQDFALSHYPETFASRFDLVMNDEKVGSIALIFSEPEIYISDDEAFEQWAAIGGYVCKEENGETYIDAEWRRYASKKDLIPGTSWTKRNAYGTSVNLDNAVDVLSLVTPEDVYSLLVGTDG